MLSDQTTIKETEETMFNKIKKILILLSLLSMFISLSAVEMNLWCNGDVDAFEKFAALSVEEQYSSYINSFKDIIDGRGQQTTWARLMVSKYGRDVLPLMNETIRDLTFDYVYKKPYDSTSECIYYLIAVIIDKKILTDIEKELYAQIFQAKIENYILKYKIIDGTVRLTHSFLVLLRGIDTRKETSESWRDYYQERLGIEDIVAGDINQYWH